VWAQLAALAAIALVLPFGRAVDPVLERHERGEHAPLWLLPPLMAL
jgi:hypothetical protein